MPYANRPAPISNRGLAIIIIDNSVEANSMGTAIRFPARCERTSEPVIISARMLQLGRTTIVRNAPAQVSVVEEVDTCVIRALVYKDEYQGDWHKFVFQPVKAILQALPAIQPTPDGAHRVIDCWDRQFLTLKLAKSKPSESDLFIVTLRLERTDLKALLATSGADAIYIEPRDITGKEPSQTYRVIWLNKHDKSSARVAQQTTQTWSSLVRSGARYGLRIAAADAPAVHAQHT
eukprot:Skav229782  [mRNA]  locus=scaffold684:667:1368:- [translate_table: standard]